MSNNDKLLITSSVKGVLISAQISLIATVALLFIICTLTTHNLRAISEYRELKQKSDAVKQERENARAMAIQTLTNLSEELKQERKNVLRYGLPEKKKIAKLEELDRKRVMINITMPHSMDEYEYYFMKLSEPDLATPSFMFTWVGIAICLGLLLWLVFSWASAHCRTRNTLEFDFEKGRCHWTAYQTFGRERHGEYTFDILTGIRINYGFYGTNMNVARLTIYGERFDGGETEEYTWHLPYCASASSIGDAINEKLRTKGMNAVKVQIVE